MDRARASLDGVGGCLQIGEYRPHVPFVFFEEEEDDIIGGADASNCVVDESLEHGGRCLRASPPARVFRVPDSVGPRNLGSHVKDEVLHHDRDPDRAQQYSHETRGREIDHVQD